MACLRIITNEVFRKTPKHMYDDGVDCIVSSDGLMSFHHYHDDGDLFAFGTLVFAPEISKIFILDIYGFNFHGFADQTEFTDIDGLEENDHAIRRNDLYDVLLDMFPSYQEVRFGVDEFQIAQETYKNNILQQTPILASIFPSLVVSKITREQIPSWAMDVPEIPFLPEIFNVDPYNHRTAFAHFLVFDPVSICIYASD